MNPFVVREGDGRTQIHACPDGKNTDVGADIFARGLFLPSDNKMTAEQQDRIIESLEDSLVRSSKDNKPSHQYYIQKEIPFQV